MTTSTTRILNAQHRDKGGAVFNVKHKDFGAVGDGSTDDTLAINAAITAAIAAKGSVFFPPSATPYIAKAIAANGAVTIWAHPGTATLKLKTLAALDGSPIINVTAPNVSVIGLAFDGNKAAQPADGFADAYDTGPNSTGRAYRSAIKMKDTGSLWSGLTVDRCTFTATYGACVATLNIAKVRVTNCVADSCNFELAYLYGSTSGTAWYAGHQVLGNRATNMGSGDPTTNSSAYVLTCAEDFVVANNVAISVERCGVKLEYPRRGVVSGNTLSNASVLNFSGIQLQSTQSAVTVVGNRIYNFGAGILLNPQAGQISDGISIIGNVIDTTTSVSGLPDGINAGVGILQGLTISGNTLRGVKRNCIAIQPTGAVTDLTIVGNNGTTTGTTAGGGLLLQPNSGNWRNVLVEDNLFDCGNAALASAGIYITCSDSSVIAMLKITNNLVDVGTGHNGIRENTACVTSGVVDGNLVDGAIFLQSSGFRCGDANQVIAGSGNTTGAPALFRTATASPVTVLTEDTLVIANLSVAGAVTVNLPQFPQAGRRLRIKDGKGDAATNNITVTAFSGQSIDSLGTYVIKSNWGAVELEAISAFLWRIVSKPHGTAAAITSPTAPSAAYVQAEATSMKTAVDAIIAALTNARIIA